MGKKEIKTQHQCNLGQEPNPHKNHVGWVVDPTLKAPPSKLNLLVIKFHYKETSQPKLTIKMYYRRLIIPGSTYFFTVNLLNRQSKLLVDQVDKLRDSFQSTQKSHPFKLDSIVILPDHFHMIMTLPEGDTGFSLRLRLIKAYFSSKIAPIEYISPSRKMKNERGIWQRRFWEHLIRDDKDYQQHMNYIHYNPVKHNHVKRAADWPYSSIHRHIKSGDLPINWGHDYNPLKAQIGGSIVGSE